jgi:hypothetical protein
MMDIDMTSELVGVTFWRHIVKYLLIEKLLELIFVVVVKLTYKCRE